MAEPVEPVDVDVVVIGAGLAGLRAAERVAQGGRRVAVLEAKGRVGGRTHTVCVPEGSGDHWDLGGQWVGSTQHRALKLIDELGLKVYRQFNEGTKFLQDGAGTVHEYSGFLPKLGVATLADLVAALGRMELTLWSLFRFGVTPARARTLDGLDAEAMMRKELFYGSFGVDVMLAASRVITGAELTSLSALGLMVYLGTCGGFQAAADSEPGTAQEFRIEGGAMQLSERLADRLPPGALRLSSPVVRVTTAKGRVEVETAGGERITARLAICAIPPHLTRDLRFEPFLPAARRELANNAKMGHLVKIIMVYETAFWREQAPALSGEVVSCPGPLCNVWDGVSHRGTPALVGFLGGDQALEWRKLSDADRRTAVLDHMVLFFGDRARNIKHYLEKDWNSEPFNGGCPACIPIPGAAVTIEPWLRQPCERVHWCGTETATQWRGYLEGALESGERAAAEVLLRLDNPAAELGTDPLAFLFRGSATNSWVLLGGAAAATAVAVGYCCLAR